MCGIVGIITNDHNPQLTKIAVENMLHTINHRGPDANGIWHQDNVTLGHVRLSIIDLAARSNQPIVNENTGDVITYNGEIYNYVELRKELELLGHVFHTTSDTEVVLKAFEQWSVDCLKKFNGMWAFAIYHHSTRTIFASRDRFGIKPFIYGKAKNGDLVFASEAKAILKAYPEFSRKNYDFCNKFVESDFFACYEPTFYDGLQNLMPGHYFIAGPNQPPEQIRFWDWKPEEDFSYKSSHEVHEHFNYLLEDSLKLRFRSDVPVGACMSGGLDSTTLVGLSSKLFNKQIHTFSCIYPEHPQYDESYYINKAVKKFDTIAEYTTPSPDDYINTMLETIHEQDGPTGGPSIISQRAVMKLASSKVKVLIDGQGADELLGGYHGYFSYSLMSSFRSLKKNLSPIEIYRFSRAVLATRKRLGKLPINLLALGQKAKAPVNFQTSTHSKTPLSYHEPYNNDDLNTILLEHLLLNIPNLLHYEDRNSMRYSLETRLPFLDYRLVEFSLSLPHRYKIDGRHTKKLLYNVAENILPNELLNRKDKMGFATPGHIWFAEKNNLRYFKRYMRSNNPIFETLSPFMRQFLTDAWNKLNNERTVSKVQPGEVNALWRFFTTNMWEESL